MVDVTIDTKETTLNPFVLPQPVTLPDEHAERLAAAKHLGDLAVASAIRYLRSELFRRREETMARIDEPGALERAVHLDSAYQTYSRLLDAIRDESTAPGLYGPQYLVELAGVADSLAQRGGVPMTVANLLKRLRDAPLSLAVEVYA